MKKIISNHIEIIIIEKETYITTSYESKFFMVEI